MSKLKNFNFFQLKSKVHIFVVYELNIINAKYEKNNQFTNIPYIY